MNMGAEMAKGEILYFVHADTRPPLSFLVEASSVGELFFMMLSIYFRLLSPSFVKNKCILYMIWSNYVSWWCQILFITRALFNELGGFREDFMIMEAYDLIQKIQQQSSFKNMPKDAIVSSRKYDENGYLKVQIANLTVFLMYFLGTSQDMKCHAYRNMLDYR